MKLPQVAENNTPQPKDAAGDVVLYDEFMAYPSLNQPVLKSG